MNSFGKIYRLTTFGESHGSAIGGIIDGLPGNMPIDLEQVQRELDRRKPAQSDITTMRRESDTVEFLSGIYEGRTLGTPVAFIIRNTDHHSADYEELRTKYRPGHADFTYDCKFGHRDHRGGGRASARETASRVVAGAIAKQLLALQGITVNAYTMQIGDVAVPEEYRFEPSMAETTESNAVRCPHPETAARMIELVKNVKAEGDTLGGIVGCLIDNVPKGLGEPVFDKLQATLAHAMMSINAAKGFEYGMGFDGCRRRGSEVLDTFAVSDEGAITTIHNHSGGIQGGIANGQPICFRVAFKPVATLLKEIDTVDIHGCPAKLHMGGRHDPCVVPRAVPIVEAMAAMTLIDAIMLDNARNFEL